MLKNEKGYTIVEMLVALSLLGLLLFFSNDILGKIVLNNKISLKAKAISIARNQMESTLIHKELKDNEKEINKFFVVKKYCMHKGNFIEINIQVFQKRNLKVLYQLTALVPNE